MKNWVILDGDQIIRRTRGDLPPPEVSKSQRVVSDDNLLGTEKEPVDDGKTPEERKLVRPSEASKSDDQPDTFSTEEAAKVALMWLLINEWLASGKIMLESRIKFNSPDGDTKNITVEKWKKLAVNLAVKVHAVSLG